MRSIFVLLVTVTLALGINAQISKCLPSDVKEDNVVSIVTTTSKGGIETSKPVTVKQTLKKLKAKCARGKLVDRKRREIRFYNLQGCWGNPPVGYQEILENQRSEIADLKKKYTVIEMTCNTSGIPRY